MKLLVRQMANGYMAYASSDNVLVHIAIAEKAYGRKLPKGAEVHHVDQDKTNNSPSNLVVCVDHAYHALLHSRQRIFDAGGHPDTHKICSTCKGILLREAFVKSKNRYDGLNTHCRECVSEYKKAKGYNIDKFDWKAVLSQQYRRLKTNYTKRAISWL